MANLTNDQKAQLYNQMLFQYQRLQEEARRIKAESFELSPENQRKVNQIEAQMKKIFNDTQRLYS
jgi:trans-2-enoyl-CoA reductase